jgi:hypothetical protein
MWAFSQDRYAETGVLSLVTSSNKVDECEPLVTGIKASEIAFRGTTSVAIEVGLCTLNQVDP